MLCFCFVRITFMYSAYTVSNCISSHTEQIPLYNRTITCTGELPPATNCTNASIPCCTVPCCNHTVKEQVEHYINEKKLDG